MLAWLSVWCEVQTCIWPSWCHCHSLSLASVKSRLVLPFLYRLTRVVLENRAVKRACVCLSFVSLWNQVMCFLVLLGSNFSGAAVFASWHGTVGRCGCSTVSWLRVWCDHSYQAQTWRTMSTDWVQWSASQYFYSYANKGKGSPYSITAHRVPKQVTWVINPAVCCYLVTLVTLKRAASNFAAWWTEAQRVWTVCLRLLPDSIAAAIWTQALLCLSPAR